MISPDQARSISLRPGLMSSVSTVLWRDASQSSGAWQWTPEPPIHLYNDAYRSQCRQLPDVKVLL